ncbi:MAG: LCCL domain-containing protein, partial [Verrucomicrobiota bacterium JB023]|nr:LCCL domain-containing protein [Verrucomicrobiota bacterium JB023]
MRPLNIIAFCALSAFLPAALPPGASITSPTPYNMMGYRANPTGSEFYFEITGTSGGLGWGTDIYTDDSNLAYVATHSGAVAAGETAVVKVTLLGEQPSYTGSIQNGLSTSDWGYFGYSFSVEPCGGSVDFSITSQPESVTGPGGTTVSLSVATDGTGVTYQWYLGESGDTSSPLSGETSASLSTTISASPQNYWVQATNASGSLDSNTATVSAYITGNPPVWLDITPNVPGPLSTENIGPLLADGSTIYALGATGIYRSTNNGDSFEAFNTVDSASYGLDITGLRFVEKAGNFIYVGTAPGSLSMNNDYTPMHRLGAGQSSWTQASQIYLPDTVYTDSVEDVAYDPTSGNYYAASAIAGMYFSTDGLTWEARNNGLAPISSVAGDFYNGGSIAFKDGKLFLSITHPFQGGIYESSDEGLTWTFSGTDSGTHGEIALFDDRIVMSTTGALTSGDGVYYSEDNGATWETREKLGPGIDIRANSTHLFAAAGNSGLKFSASAGTTWQDLDETNLPNDITPFWLEPTETHLFALAFQGDQVRLFRRPLNSFDLSLETRITVDPSNGAPNQILNEGQAVDFVAEAVGPNVSYQWTFNGVDIPGATSPTLSYVPTESGALNLTVTSSDGTFNLENDINITLAPTGPGYQDLRFAQTANPIRGVAFVAPNNRVVQIEAPRLHVFDRDGNTLATRSDTDRIRNGFVDSQGNLMVWGEFTLARYDWNTLQEAASFTPVFFESTTIRINGAAELPGTGYLLALERDTFLDGQEMPPLALFDYSGNYVSDLGFGFINFSPSYSPRGMALVPAPDGSVFASLQSARFADQTIVPEWIKLNSDGSLDNSFDIEQTLNGDVQHVQADGKILYAGTSGNRQVFRLNADGSKDTSYDPGNTQYEDDVYGMVTDSQGRIYVYGEFRSYGGV